MKHSINSYNISEIPQILATLKQPKFRAKQLVTWLYRDNASSYDAMTNLPASLRATLAEEYPLVPLSCIDKQVSSDGTRKYVFECFDGTRVETVGIPSYDKKETRDEPKHLTVCFSTQAGCAMQCAFCATGEEGLTRNLSSGEMIAQICAVQDDFDCRVTNLVSMGQGEPFQNYDALLDALRFANNKDGLGIGARHITVSTCGVLPGIQQLAHEPEQFTLAVSLHSAVQSTRDNLMPRCKSMPLRRLKEELITYIERTGRRVSFEYLMIKDVNDSESDLQELISFCDGILCHINLIPINATDGNSFTPSSPQTQEHWMKQLRRSGKECTIRDSRGSDIDGACGQLKNKLAHS